MATYNGERFLNQQLDSLSAQTQAPSELVVCDDRSTDRSIDIVKRFAETAPFPVRLFVNDARLGYRANFLKAASLCWADYIAFCDQDDVWLKDKLSIVTRSIQETQCTLLHHNYRLIDDNGASISGEANHEFVKRHASWRHSGGLTQVFHRSLMDYLDLWALSVDHNVDDDKMAHDQWIFFLSYVLGKTIFIDDVLVLYRQHAGNLVGIDRPVGENRPLNVGGTFLVNASRFYGRGAALKEKRNEAIWIIQRRAKAAAARAKIIDAIMLRSDEANTGRLRGHAQYYRGMEIYWSGRLSAYFSAPRRKRLQAVLSLYRRGLYQAQGGQGVRDAVVDMLYGVMY